MNIKKFMKKLAVNGNLTASVSVQDMFTHPRDRKLVIALMEEELM